MVTTGDGGCTGVQVDHLLLAERGGAFASLPTVLEVPTAALDSTREAGASGSASGVEEMMERLRLMAIEAYPVMVDDDDDADLVDPNCALVGKVLSPTVLHTNTISSAMRPAWGNPKGLLIHPAGDNLFVAEFSNKMDRDRVLEGSPWMVGKHDVLLKFFDPNIQPL